MDSLYASGEPTGGEPKKPETPEEDKDETENTALVPMKVLQGAHPDPVKEGDEVVLKVVKVYGDEAEVAYSETPPGEIGKSEDADAELDAMDKSGGGSVQPGGY